MQHSQTVHDRYDCKRWKVVYIAYQMRFTNVISHRRCDCTWMSCIFGSRLPVHSCLYHTIHRKFYNIYFTLCAALLSFRDRLIERYYILQEKKYTKKNNFFISPVDRCDNISFGECFFFSQKRYFREKKARVYRVKSMQTHRVLINWYIKSCCIYTSLTFETFTWDLIY